jgi:hypothetical protein
MKKFLEADREHQKLSGEAKYSVQTLVFRFTDIYPNISGEIVFISDSEKSIHF